MQCEGQPTAFARGRWPSRELLAAVLAASCSHPPPSQLLSSTRPPGPLPKMQCIRCWRSAARPAIAAPLTSTTRLPFAAMQQYGWPCYSRVLTDNRYRLRSISILSPRRPQLLPTSAAAIPQPIQSLPAAAASETLDLLPKVSTHPALQGIQVRNGPRDTFKPTNLVRKRRHGFLSRLKTRKGRATLKRRKAKGRNTLSH